MALSEKQQKIYDMLQEGKSPVAVRNALSLDAGTYRAQLTRIKNKGVVLPNYADDADSGFGVPTPSDRKPAKQDPTVIPASGTDGAKQVLESVEDEEVVLNIEEAISTAQAEQKFQGTMETLHPMAVFGVTMQFMKMCGGRFHAHQVIEDVYAAARMHVGDAPKADEILETQSHGLGDDGELEEVISRVAELQDSLETELNKLRTAGSPS